MPASWSLFIHQLPPEPLYLRAKTLRRLARAGAVALKNGVYVLPDGAEPTTTFEGIAAEVQAGGGHAYVCRASFRDERTDAEIVDLFRKERQEDYERLQASLRARMPGGAAPGDRKRALRVARARKRFEEISRIDFFGAQERQAAKTLIEILAETASGREHRSPGRGQPRGPGARWVTRRGVQVDRIASAWLIRRFIDPHARFRFVDPSEPSRPEERRFDIVPGDFTHEEDRCTFETLLASTRLADPGLPPIAEIVHELDLKDEKFSRPEAAGIGRLLAGVVAGERTDEGRLERGFALFDDLYRAYGGLRLAAQEIRS